jgi:hypothetical protein
MLLGVKLVPVIVTLLPTGPLEGLKLEIVGVAIMVKLLLETEVPPGVTTVIGPVVAPLGTLTVIEVFELIMISC